jgi:hypothetical protein
MIWSGVVPGSAQYSRAPIEVKPSRRLLRQSIDSRGGGAIMGSALGRLQISEEPLAIDMTQSDGGRHAACPRRLACSQPFSSQVPLPFAYDCGKD